jgi:hypothetical protein
VVIGGHGGPVGWVDLGAVPAHPVSAFDRASYPLLVKYLKHACGRECRDVPVQSRWGDVGQPLAQLRGGGRVTIQERPQDAQPDGVQQQVKGRHGLIITPLWY